jgi:hypothetical protein
MATDHMADLRIWISSNSDKLLLAGFGLIFLLVGLQRLNYSGDGLRHLGSILRSDQPSLGEPRWILFPLLLFAIVKPFVVFSADYSISAAARVFVLFNVVCGCVYLLCLRRWISELRANQRFAVLLLAGGSSTFLALATDTIEPTAAVTIAIIGVTFARFKKGLSDGVRLIIAILAIALASLLYQGLLFGLFFLPAIFPVTILFSGRNAFRIIFLGVVGPLGTITLLTLGGESPRNAMGRFLQGEANQLSSQQYSVVSPKNFAGVVIVGPTYALASIPERRGLKGSVRLLSHLDTALEGIIGAAAWLCTAIALIAAVVIVVHKRQFGLLFAFAGIMLLPMIRMSQYSYLKFYVLLPFLVVLVVPRLKVKFIYPGTLGALILVSNLGHFWAERTELKSLRLQVAHDLYPHLPEGTCFVSSGWGCLFRIGVVTT